MATSAVAPLETTFNVDIVGLYNRMNRFIEEMMRSVSGSLSITNNFDTGRLNTYLDSVDRYHAHISKEPYLDLPETHPRLYKLYAAPIVTSVENDDIDDIVNLLVLARDELLNSQSARMPVGLIAPDSLRFTAIIQKARNFLNDYIIPTQPLDLPESSPFEPMTIAGHTGINPT
jgi:hypothetical protein